MSGDVARATAAGRERDEAPTPAPLRLPTLSGRPLLRALARYVRPQRGVAGVAILLAAAAAVAGLALPFGVGRLVDAVTGAGAGDADARRTLATLLVVVAAATVLSSVLGAVSSALVARVAQHAIAPAREEAMAAALRLPAPLARAAGVRGDLLARVGDDSATVSRVGAALLAPWVQALTTIVVTLGGLLALDPLLALAGALAIPVYVLAVRWYLPRSAPLYRAEREAAATRTAAVLGVLDGAATLRAYDAVGVGVGQVEGDSDAARTADRVALWFSTRWARWINIAEVVGLGAIITVGFLLVRGDVTTIGAVSAATLFFHRLFNPVGLIVFSFTDMQQALAALGRVLGVREAPRVRERTDRLAGSVRTVGLRFSYGDHEALRGVDLDVAPGQLVAVVGTSGSGKSTLAAVLAGAMEPTSGSVELAGEPGPAPSAARAAGEPPPAPSSAVPTVPERGVVLLPQRSHLFSGTIAENVAVARPGSDDATVAAALAEVGAHWVTELPDGLATPVGEDGVELDPERAAHVALARAALADPAVVVVDELTAGMGAAAATRVEGVLRRLAGRRTVVAVAHRLSQARTADRVVVLERGRVVDDGAHDALLQSDGVYARYWRAWVG